MKKILNFIIAVLFVAGGFSCDKEPKLSSEKEILSFQINGVEGQIYVNSSGVRLIQVFLPLETDRSALAPVILVSDKATVIPESGATQDFSEVGKTKRYTVIAEDGSQQRYEVTTPPAQSDIL
ncbi:MAG: hypothetical protein FWE30_00485 [Bacteroidales bacterium]|nr:hypothetical protein [Bacteroidales bacterium]